MAQLDLHQSAAEAIRDRLHRLVSVVGASTGEQNGRVMAAAPA